METSGSSSVSVEPCPIQVHWNWDIVHTPWSSGGVVLIAGTCLVGLVRAIIGKCCRAIIGLKSSSLVIVVVWEISKRSSSEPSTRNKGGSIALSGLVSLGTLSENVL